MLGNRGNVSIFTGALLSNDHKREMIADWDLRAASELTSYFSKQQYKPIIEKPIYEYRRLETDSGQACENSETVSNGESQTRVTDSTGYVNRILKVFEIANKTGIIIGSPDVSPL